MGRIVSTPKYPVVLVKEKENLVNSITAVVHVRNCPKGLFLFVLKVVEIALFISSQMKISWGSIFFVSTGLTIQKQTVICT